MPRASAAILLLWGNRHEDKSKYAKDVDMKEGVFLYFIDYS